MPSTRGKRGRRRSPMPTFRIRVDWLESGENAGNDDRSKAFCHLPGCHEKASGAEREKLPTAVPPTGRTCRLPGCSATLAGPEGRGRPQDWCDRKHSDLFYRRRDTLDTALQEMADLRTEGVQLTRDGERKFAQRQRLLAEARASYVLASELPLVRADPGLARFPWIEALIINHRRAARPSDHLCQACNGDGYINLGLAREGQVSAPHARSRRALHAALHLISLVDSDATKQAWFDEASRYAAKSD